MNDSANKAQAIFLAAIEQHAPEQWPAFLDETCGSDAPLRERVERLLRAQAELGSFHEVTQAALSATIENPVREQPGTVIGPYKLLQQIGEGGMGTVYMAEQMQPVQRKVALKIIKAGMDSKQVIARFEAERQALALMDHPNIAKVFDAGATENGRPYFVMELVKGQSITKYCDEHRLTPRQRLELFLPVCQAIQHAHQKGIIHRDIKASNVLIAPYDGKPVVKVIDFGIAKATGQRLTDKTLFTDFGAVIGTLEYMSPEQAELNNQDIDTRSDIYSLGVLLYELLTGTTPLDRSRLKESGFAELLRIIREEEPPRPSTRLSESKDTLPSISAQRQMDPAKLTKQVRGELDWIVMKALDKDRNRRYETANGFAADVQRYLNDDPVQACPPSAGYRLRDSAAEPRGFDYVGTGDGRALVGTGISVWQAVEATEARELADERLVLADDRLASEQQAKRDADEQRKRAEASYIKAREAVKQMLTRVADEDLVAIPEMNKVRLRLFKDAVAFYTELLKISPRDAQAYFERGIVYSHLLQGDNALADFHRALELDPENAEIHYRLGVEYIHRLDYSKSDCKKGIVHTQRSLELKPGRRACHANLAVAYLRVGDSKKGRVHLEIFAKQAPKSAHAYAELASLYFQFKDYQNSLVHSESGVALDPTNSFILLQWARSLNAHRKYKEAYGAVNQAIEFNRFPNNPSMSSYYELRGEISWSLDHHSAAIGDWDKVIEIAPFKYYIYKRRGLAHFRLKNYERALADITKGMELNWNDISSLTWISLAEMAACPDENFRQGIFKVFDRTIEQTNRKANAYGARASLYNAQGKYAKALADYSKAVEHRPANDAGTRNNLAWFLATCPDEKLRDVPKAVSLAEKAVELAPKDGMYWNTLGTARYRARDWRAAIADLEKATKLREGGDPYDWFVLAMAHWQLEDKDRARKYYQQAIAWVDKNGPQNKEFSRLRAEAAELLGMNEKTK